MNRVLPGGAAPWLFGGGLAPKRQSLPLDLSSSIFPANYSVPGLCFFFDSSLPPYLVPILGSPFLACDLGCSLEPLPQFT